MAANDLLDPGLDPGTTTGAERPGSRRWLRPLHIWLATGAIVAVLAGAAASRFPLRAGPSSATAAALDAAGLDPHRVAVLYFDDHSPGGGQEHLAYGLTEALIRELGEGDGLDVVSRHGVKAFRGSSTLMPFGSGSSSL